MIRSASRVRFLHVFPSYGPGGAELRVTNTINRMGPEAGHAILSINGNVDAAAELDPRCQVPVFKAPSNRGRLRFPRDLWLLIRDVSPAVLLTYNWGATDAIIGARLARFRPVIHNECGFSHEFAGSRWHRRLARRLLLGGCYRTVVTAETMLQTVQAEFGIPRRQIAFIKTGVDIQRFQPRDNPALRERIGAAAGGVIFGCVGRLRPSKNIEMLLEAFARIRRPSDRLVLFGDGRARSQLEQRVQQMQLADAVQFQGHIRNVADVYGAIDIYVTTSKSEAASNSLLEAMASGLPAVSVDIADNRLILSPENRRFVYLHEDLAGYAEGLRRMADDADLRSHLGRLNRQRVETEYPLDRMIHEYHQLWEDAAQLRTAR